MEMKGRGRGRRRRRRGVFLGGGTCEVGGDGGDGRRWREGEKSLMRLEMGGWGGVG